METAVPAVESMENGDGAVEPKAESASPVKKEQPEPEVSKANGDLNGGGGTEEELQPESEKIKVEVMEQWRNAESGSGTIYTSESESMLTGICFKIAFNLNTSSLQLLVLKQGSYLQVTDEGKGVKRKLEEPEVNKCFLAFYLEVPVVGSFFILHKCMYSTSSCYSLYPEYKNI